MKKLLVTLLAATALAALPGRAHAQARLTFSGGNGTPLTINLLSPISFVITTAPTTISAPVFDLQGVGNLFPGGGSYQAGGDTIAFSVNGGPAMVEGAVTSGQTNGSFAAADFLFLTTDAPLAVGNTVVLSAGHFTTQLDVAGAPPASGSYPTFIADGNGLRLSAANGLAVPEPSTWVLLGMGALVVTGAHRRKISRPVRPSGSSESPLAEAA